MVGAIVFLATPPALGPAFRGTVGWVVGVVMFLGLTLIAFGDASPARVQARAKALDERTPVMLILIVAAAAASYGALGFVLHKPVGSNTLAGSRVILAALTVAASWLLVHTTFAVHYAHFYYGDPDDEGPAETRGGLQFPGDTPPDYWDFMYYSFVVGMTCQVSDVQVTLRGMRRLTLAHGVLSFFFNTGLLALAINILASVL